MRGNLATLAMR